VAYFDQEQSDLNPDSTALETIWELDPMVPAEKIRSYLGRFGFSDEEQFKMVGTLSGGEKTKLALARLMYHPANFIILDEPTNHLDIQSREALEEALQLFDGSCLIVSHDRYFLDRVVNKIFHVTGGRINQYLGTYSHFRERTASKPVVHVAKDTNKKMGYEASKEKARAADKKKKEIASLKAKIGSLEKELTSLDSAIRNDIPRTDWEALNKTAKQKQKAEESLLDLYGKLDALEGSGDA
jgi:ATP-binding cassette subfamily F protein 3